MGWYDDKVKEYGPWIRSRRPTRKDIKQRLRDDGHECGSHRALELRRRVLEPTRRPTKGPNILVIGDAHFEPNQSMARAHMLGKFIRDQLTERDHVVCIGDWHGLTSLCSYNSALENEGARLENDIRAGNRALHIVMSYLDEVSRPTLHITIGNHEQRLTRLAKERPEFHGLIGLHQLSWADEGWEVSDFLEPLRIEGWRFQHYFQNGAGRAVSSKKYPARRVLEEVEVSESCVFGHTHRLDIQFTRTAIGGSKWGINVGCYFEHIEEYAGPDANNRWWRGLVMIRDARDGDGCIDLWSMDRIRAFYG